VHISAQQSDASLQWAQRKLSSMTLEEKIGQLFMIRAHSDLGNDHIKSVENQIKKYKVGGLCFFQGTPTKQAELTQRYQNMSDIPLMVAIDAEWGLGMRHIKSAITYPKQLTLGAIKDNTLLYDMGRDIATQLKRIGVHVNFAPVVDINNNPANPVIHNRSFGEDMFNVATKSFAYMKGMQENGIMACAKHFPGHGDTDIDSHYDLPLIPHERQRLDSLELMPFRVLTQLGIQSMMSAHLSVPALDPTPNRPTSLSRSVVTGLLQEDMNFEGLIFTDGLEMKGVADHFGPGIMELEAIKAGNDIMLLPIDIAKAVNVLTTAVRDKSLSEEVINQKVLKILTAKHKLKLDRKQRITNISGINKDINDKKYLALKYELYENAVTLVNDEKAQIPIQNIDSKKIASLTLGSDSKSVLQESLDKFGINKHIHAPKNLTTSKINEIKASLNNYEDVIISLQGMNIYKSKKYGISQGEFDLIYKLNTTHNVILILHGSPYALSFFDNVPTIIQAYEEDALMQKAVVQAIMGASRISGKLPVSASAKFPVKAGLDRSGFFRLGYTFPEAVGISSDSLLAIDTIIAEMISKKAAPGCQVLAVKNGKIFYDKNFGYHTYAKKRAVRADDVYDVASVTKILATNISLMKLYEESKVNIYDPIKKYLPQLDTTNKGELIIEDILAHQSGLPGWIPFYADTMDKDSRRPKRRDDYYSNTQKDSFNINVINNLWIRDVWRDSIYNMIYNCDLRENRNYRYSDLGYYLFHQLIEAQTNTKLDKYVEENFYKPMGLKNTLFNPLKRIPLDRIPPTEKDEYFRLQTVKGYVHDMGAAMLGGVSGHAGLFSTSKDLASIMQMLLNGGTYQGKKYLKPKTIQKFTNRYYKSTRRGLGFDMKELDPDKKLNVAEEVSYQAFGHLGFTGVSVYADPKYDLIYIFISNRTFPSMNNNVFSRKNYRPRVQSVFYKAMMDHRING
jgi:beta-glucosidase-like glycosyl hydrolase/CubicO group peptidase (beta-lactamase class C family)